MSRSKLHLLGLVSMALGLFEIAGLVGHYGQDGNTNDYGFVAHLIFLTGAILFIASSKD